MSAATTPSVTRGSSNRAIETANIPAGTGAYFGYSRPSSRTKNHGLTASARAPA
ncbi:hypothetical protein ACFQMM_16235 [Saliphagus sp. GCM10025308]